MATLRSKSKLAAVAWESKQEHLGNSRPRNTAVPRSNKEYIASVPKMLEDRVVVNVWADQKGGGGPYVIR